MANIFEAISDFKTRATTAVSEVIILATMSCIHMHGQGLGVSRAEFAARMSSISARKEESSQTPMTILSCLPQEFLKVKWEGPIFNV